MDFGCFAGSDSASTTAAFAERNQKRYGSGLNLKHQTSPSNEDDWRSSKLPRTEDSSALLRSNGSVFSDGQPQMLCFSAPKSETSVAFPYLNRNSGYSSGNVNVHELRGPFTASQWVELEHQALIYKYIDANVPVPTHLLLPIRKAFDSVPFSAFSCGLLRQNTYGWGGFHLGFANSTDPEPGRCRRTDGKKWRCSRDAMADQKYCERHMNRGRHRSRKPVEGLTGHPAAAKLTSSSAAVLESGGGATNRVAIAQPQSKNLQSGAVSDFYHSRLASNSEINGITETSTPADANPFLLPKQLMNFGDSSSWTTQQYSLRQFMDNGPDTDPHLSISLPLSAKTTDFMSSTSSPTKENPTLSPLRLSRDQYFNTANYHPYQRQARNWIPVSWEPSMGGPLAEALHTTTNNGVAAECRNPSAALNLMSDGWDNSPTGVLQKSSFNSLSNSSAGSSPKAESSKNLCEDLLGSGLVHSAQLPAL